MIVTIPDYPWYVWYLVVGVLYAFKWAWSEKNSRTAGLAMVFIPVLWPLAMWVSLGVSLQYIGERWRRGGRGEG